MPLGCGHSSILDQELAPHRAGVDATLMHSA